jgi:ATP synthase protein I
MAADDEERLAQAARRRREREMHWRREGERPLGRNLAMIGAYGWLVIAPTVGGVFLGRWLDGLRGGGIVFTAALVLLGAGAGMWLTWRRMNED